MPRCKAAIWRIGCLALKKFGFLSGLGVYGTGCLVTISPNSMLALFDSMVNAGSEVNSFLEIGCGSGAVALMATLFGWQQSTGLEVRHIPKEGIAAARAFILGEAARHSGVSQSELSELSRRLGRFKVISGIDCGTDLSLVMPESRCMGGDVYAWFSSWNRRDIEAVLEWVVSSKCKVLSVCGNHPLSHGTVHAHLGQSWTVCVCADLRVYGPGTVYKTSIFVRYHHIT
jgi:hypothetical protein